MNEIPELPPELTDGRTIPPIFGYSRIEVRFCGQAISVHQSRVKHPKEESASADIFSYQERLGDPDDL